MERTIAQMDSKIATTKAENASIDNLPPIPAGPAVPAESGVSNFVNDGDDEPVEKKTKGGLRDTVTKMVTDDLQKKGLIDKLEAKYAQPVAQPEPSQEYENPNAHGTVGGVDQLNTGVGNLRAKEVALPANF